MKRGPKIKPYSETVAGRCHAHGVPVGTYYSRRSMGWGHERAMTEKPNSRIRHIEESNEKEKADEKEAAGETKAAEKDGTEK